MLSFHVDPEGQPVDLTATEIDTISSTEQTSAPIEVDLETSPTFTAPATTNNVTRAGASNAKPFNVSTFKYSGIGYRSGSRTTSRDLRAP
jgi:hypothetical protein